MKVQIINRSAYPLPEYATEGSAGMDLIANLEYDFTLLPGTRLAIPTGLYIEIPKGYEGQVRPRSGLALKHGITVLNTPGTIDSDFRGEIKVILANTGSEPVKIFPGDRIAQIIFAKHERVEFEQVEVLQESDRGFGGFGSTGK
jgi:dUTP pyrophosphatase